MAPSGRAYTAGMGRNGVWPRVLVAFLVVPWIQAGIDAAGRKDKDQEPAKDKEKPHLRLVVDASVGFPPVTVTATGWLTGVDPRDANFCHAAVTWTKVEPGQTEDGASTVREDPGCLHPPEQVDVQTSFTKTFVFYNPGSYLIRLAIEGKNKTRVRSGFAKVEVLRPQ